VKAFCGFLPDPNSSDSFTVLLLYWPGGSEDLTAGAAMSASVSSIVDEVNFLLCRDICCPKAGADLRSIFGWPVLIATEITKSAWRDDRPEIVVSRWRCTKCYEEKTRAW